MLPGCSYWDVWLLIQKSNRPDLERITLDTLWQPLTLLLLQQRMEVSYRWVRDEQWLGGKQKRAQLRAGWDPVGSDHLLKGHSSFSVQKSRPSIFTELSDCSCTATIMPRRSRWRPTSSSFALSSNHSFLSSYLFLSTRFSSLLSSAERPPSTTSYHRIFAFGENSVERLTKINKGWVAFLELCVFRRDSLSLRTKLIDCFLLGLLSFSLSCFCLLFTQNSSSSWCRFPYRTRSSGRWGRIQRQHLGSTSWVGGFL